MVEVQGTVRLPEEGTRRYRMDIRFVAVCDIKGCKAEQVATAADWNGPALEGVYGLNDWTWLAKGRIVCPKHAPKHAPARAT